MKEIFCVTIKGKTATNEWEYDDFWLSMSFIQCI